MTQHSVYAKLPLQVQHALDCRGIEDSDNLTPKECFEHFCAWHGLVGWNLWDIVVACQAAEAQA